MSGLVDYAITNYLGPIFLLIVAGGAITFLISKSIRALITYAVIVILVALFIFAGSELFGKNGNLTNTAKKATQTINFIQHERPSFLIETSD